MKSKNTSYMNTVYRLAVIVLIAAVASCNSASTKEKKGDLNDKKVQLTKMKQEQEKLAANIKSLEDEIAKEDPNAAVTAKLVAVTSLVPQNFEHYIDLQGKINTDNIYT